MSNQYGKWQKRFNDLEEKSANRILGKCSWFCGDIVCSNGCVRKATK